MEDIRAELKSYGHLVAIIFSGVVEGEEGCSMVVSVYDVVRGSLVTVSVCRINDVPASLRFP